MDELLCKLDIVDLFEISADLTRLCNENKDAERIRDFWADMFFYVREEIKDRYVDEYLKDGKAGRIVLDMDEDGIITVPFPHLRKNLKHLSISGLKTLREDIDAEIARQTEKFYKEVAE